MMGCFWISFVDDEEKTKKKKNHPRCWKGKMMDEEGKETNTYGFDDTVMLVP